MNSFPGRTCTGSPRPRVVVCGTGFGRVYLSAFRDPASPFELAGIVARGSTRSQACAQFYQVPLFRSTEDLPDDIDMACVAVGTGILGGPGTELAQQLLRQGIHVLQEHPIHSDELTGCLRVARENRVQYHLNTLYIHVEPVRRFLNAAARLRQQQPIRFVDGVCAIQTACSFLDLVGATLGSLRPWAFVDRPPLDAGVAKLATTPPVYRSLDGVIGGVPITLRVQNQLNPHNPDSHAHLLHQLTIGTDAGTLSLVHTHGPVVWSPRPHMPPDSAAAVALEASSAPFLLYPSAEILGPRDMPSWTTILATLWPGAINRALELLWADALGGADPLRRGAAFLALAQVWQDATSRLGYPEMIDEDAPSPLPASALLPVLEPDQTAVLA